MADTVLVTGGTGFLAGHCLAQLLQHGHDVRTTVRDPSRESAVRATLETAGVDAGPRLSVAVADLTSDEGWAAAVDGCRYVLHVASPFPPVQPDDPDELIVPARDGALRVLRAALDADVERVVQTSSIAAVRPRRDSTPEAPYTEADWTDGADTSLTPYTRSKTIAEQAAWALARERGAEQRLAVVNPGAIIGPALNDDHSYSLQSISRMLEGMPAVPRLGFTFVDVRDVADLHRRAMTAEPAGGERFVATDRWMWMAEIAEVLRERLGPAAAKVPRRRAPNLMVKAMALFDPSIRSVVPDLGRRTWYSSDKARTMLGWTTMPTEDSVTDCARSLL